MKPTIKLSNDPNVVSYLNEFLQGIDDEKSEPTERNQFLTSSLEEESELKAINHHDIVEWHKQLVVKCLQELDCPNASMKQKALHYQWAFAPIDEESSPVPFSFHACCIAHEGADPEQVQMGINYNLKKLGLFYDLLEYIDSDEFKAELDLINSELDSPKQQNLFGVESDRQFRKPNAPKAKILDDAESCGVQDSLF